jgi:hypothetical protein
MANLIRSVTNASSVEAITLFIPGYDSNNPVMVAASATLDLLSMVSAETLHAMQSELSSQVSSGEITVAAYIPSASLWPAMLGTYLASSDTQVVFNPTTGSASHLAGASSTLQIENASGAIDFLDSSTTITVSASGGTSPKINGFASPLVLTASGGTASVLVTDTLAGTVTVSITAVSRSLTHTSTFVATLS